MELAACRVLLARLRRWGLTESAIRGPQVAATLRRGRCAARGGVGRLYFLGSSYTAHYMCMLSHYYESISRYTYSCVVCTL